MLRSSEMVIPEVEDIFPGLVVGGPGKPWTVEDLASHGAATEQFAPADRHVVGDVMREHVQASDRILEIGAGIGRLGLLAPAIYHPHYVQAEINPEASRYARNANGLPTVAADACALPFPDKSFDVVTGLNVLDMVPDTGSLAGEVSRVLRSGGTFVHFHDRRPSLQWLASHIDTSDHYVYPYVDEDGVLRRFQLIAKRTFHRTFPNPAPQLAIMANPRTVEAVRSNALPFGAAAAVDIVSARLMNTGKTQLTLPFNELMGKIAGEALARAGLTLGSSKSITRRAPLPKTNDRTYSVSVRRGEYGDFENIPTQGDPIAIATQHILMARK